MFLCFFYGLVRSLVKGAADMDVDIDVRWYPVYDVCADETFDKPIANRRMGHLRPRTLREGIRRPLNVYGVVGAYMAGARCPSPERLTDLVHDAVVLPRRLNRVTMHRSITGFHRDDAGDWVADLDCGHGQHVRHRPPFQTRPWVTTRQGRDGMLGSELDCIRCEAMEWPENLAVRRRTPEFTETSVPAGLLRDHATKRGVWCRIHVLEGALVYRVGGPIHRAITIAAGATAIIVPEVRHHVEIDGRVRFQIEFSARVE